MGDSENSTTNPSLPKPLIDPKTAQAIVSESINSYFNERRDRLPNFIDTHFSMAGAWSLNRKAFGRDVYRAPLNVALMGPSVGLKVAAAGFDKMGRPDQAERLRSRNLLLKTDVSQELEWRIYTDLLEVPYAQDGRHAERDALSEAIFNHPKMYKALEDAVQKVLDDAGPRNRAQLEKLMTSYLDTRAANAEVANLAICLLTGAVVAQKITPGVLTLGPTMANTLAQTATSAQFPLGATIGHAWYGAFPVAPTAALAAGTTGSLLAVGALVAAFSGIITDPIQRALGFHHRRLERFIDTLEQNLVHDQENRLKVRDHYVARITDLFDALGAVLAHT